MKLMTCVRERERARKGGGGGVERETKCDSICVLETQIPMRRVNKHEFVKICDSFCSSICSGLSILKVHYESLYFETVLYCCYQNT